MLKSKMFVSVIVLLILTVFLAACGPTTTPEIVEETVEPEPAEPVKILWWSHWAEETNKRAVLDQVIADYEAEHPDVDIEIVWWQKADMWPAIQNTMTAGTGFPDIFYYDTDKPEFIEAGWVADQSGTTNWDNVEGWAKDFWAQGSAVYALTLEAYTNDIYYNVAHFEELGINVPEDNQFTADEFLDVIKTCREAGYDPLGQPGDYWAGAQRFYKYILLHQLGSDKFEKYWLGDIPADDPDALKAIEYTQEVMAVPALPTTFSTMGLAEAHTYFHTQQKSCMFIVGSWYTGRAFVPPEDGGQPADFRLSFLKYPEMPGGAGNNEHFMGAAGSLAVAEKSSNKDIALDIVNFFAQEKYGNMWMANTGVQTGIKTNPATMPETPYPWYFEEYAKTHEGLDMYVHNVGLHAPEMKEAWGQVFNEGLPLDLITVDEAVQMLEDARAAAGKK